MRKIEMEIFDLGQEIEKYLHTN